MMKRVLLWVLTLATLMLVTGVVYAQSGGSYDLSWHAVDGGGVTFSTGGTYTLGGTIGQPDAGQLTGDDYILGGGFWGGGTLTGATCAVYLPLVVRGQ